MTCFIANIIKINPPIISKYFALKFLKKFPSQYPKFELINVTTPINIEATIIGLFVKESDIPEDRASILVAIPTKNNDFKHIFT